MKLTTKVNLAFALTLIIPLLLLTGCNDSRIESLAVKYEADKRACIDMGGTPIARVGKHGLSEIYKCTASCTAWGEAS